MAKGAVLARRIVGHAALPVLGLPRVAHKTEIRLSLEQKSFMDRAVRKVAGPAIETFRRLVFHRKLFEFRLYLGMAFQAEFAGLFSHHIGEITRMVGMTPQTIPFGKGLVGGNVRVSFGQSLVAVKAQFSPGLFLLEQNPVFTLVGLMTTAALATGKWTVEAVEPHLIAGPFVTREA